jgi:NhaA family Na+:H+ antiporter
MAAALGLALWLRRRGTRSFWPYVIGPGSLSWAALHLGGFHPALALVPVVPFMLHGAKDLGLFDRREESQADTLNRFERRASTPVQFVLFFFGFSNAGVPFTQVGPGTWFVLAALPLGKPSGILLFSGAARLSGVRLPVGVRNTDLLVVGIAASIGFTVSLFFGTAAFPHREPRWTKQRWVCS